MSRMLVANTVRLKCSQCGVEFDKRRSVYNRAIRLGQRHAFCSRAHAATFAREAHGIRLWTVGEIEFLRNHVDTLSHAEIADHLGRTRTSVSTYAKRIGLIKWSRWTADEDAFIRMHIGKMTHTQMVSRLRRSAYAVNVRIQKLGLAVPILKSNPLDLAKCRKLYDLGCSDEEIGENVGRSWSAVRHWRISNGLPSLGRNDRWSAKESLRRRKDGRFFAGLLRYNQSRRGRAAVMGWPAARGEGEARVLDILADGPKIKQEIGAAMGTLSPTKEGCYVITPLVSLLKRGVVVRVPIEPRGRGPRYTYALADGIARIMPGTASATTVNDIDPEDYDRLVCRIAIKRGADRARVKDSDQYRDGWDGLLGALARFDPNRGTKFISFAYKTIDGAILDGWNRRKKAPVAFSQLGSADDAEEGNAADLATTIDPEPVVEAREQATALLGSLDARARRLVEAVVMNGFTAAQAGALEDPPISKYYVDQIVNMSIAALRADGQGREVEDCEDD